MRTLVVVLGLVVGWIVLAMVLPLLLPGTDKTTSALKGALFLAYILIAIIAIRRSRKGKPGAQQHSDSATGR